METHVGHTEKGFEDAIEADLLNNGYRQGKPQDFNREFAVDTKLLFEFLYASQPKSMAKLKDIYKNQLEQKLLNRLHRELDNRSMIDVIRNGIKDYGVKIELAYFKPSSNLNKDLIELYNKNIVSVTRQVHYSLKNENSIDMLICVNGLPVSVLELKNAFTGQTVEDAKNQYRFDRNPKELLFEFKKRALVYFAVDTDEVYMTTKLAEESTFFLPFNKGRDGGKGNPENYNGYKTIYFWREVLQRDSLMDIMKKFVHLQIEEEDEHGEKTTKETLLFPRYHQLDAVRKLEEDVKQNKAGQNYLIQHSAGSGKTNSISWLAHRLSSVHDDENNSIFDSVIVITDRKVLDKQLQDNIYQFEHKLGVVQKIDEDSTKLAEALMNDTRIIITTLQKFPFVMEKVSQLGSKKYAVIIDEAHSSQTGKSAGALKEVLSSKNVEEELEKAMNEDNEAEKNQYDPEEEIYKTIKKQGKQDNISFFAFTATPKAKTLEMFGTQNEFDMPETFHLYSMRQAIEEGFILDVLQNYATYETFYKIAKKIEEDPTVDKQKGTKAIARFVSLHPHNIAQKTEIIIEHFRQVTRHKIGGKAKAMVVTSSRLHAVKYKHAFDKYIKEHGYNDIKTLVAFSGTVKDDGVDHTETFMNGFGEKELPKRLKKDEYKVLIVAEKYQTGFDQPLLHTMYVDKKLDGIKAVQTLSRLNRKCKGKTDTFVLDFVNNAEDIKEAFKPYYQQTQIDDVTDPNLLYDIEAKLKDYKVYTKEEIDNFSTTYFKPKKMQANKDKGMLNYYIDTARQRFISLTQEEQDEFKSTAVKYVRIYAFVLQIGPFADIDLHKLYIFLGFLLKKLPRTQGGDNVDLVNDIALEYYTNKKIFEGSVSLSPNDDNPSIPNITQGGTGKPTNEEELLSSIIGRLNEKFGTDFSTTDQLSIEQIKEDFANDEDLRLKAKTNTIDNFKYAFKDAFMSKVVDRMGQNQKFFTKVLDDENFQKAMMEYLLVDVYEKLNAVGE